MPERYRNPYNIHWTGFSSPGPLRKAGVAESKSSKKRAARLRFKMSPPEVRRWAQSRSDLGLFPRPKKGKKSKKKKSKQQKGFNNPRNKSIMRYSNYASGNAKSKIGRLTLSISSSKLAWIAKNLPHSVTQEHFLSTVSTEAQGWSDSVPRLIGALDWIQSEKMNTKDRMASMILSIDKAESYWDYKTFPIEAPATALKGRSINTPPGVHEVLTTSDRQFITVVNSDGNGLNGRASMMRLNKTPFSQQPPLALTTTPIGTGPPTYFVAESPKFVTPNSNLHSVTLDIKVRNRDCLVDQEFSLQVLKRNDDIAHTGTSTEGWDQALNSLEVVDGKKYTVMYTHSLKLNAVSTLNRDNVRTHSIKKTIVCNLNRSLVTKELNLTGFSGTSYCNQIKPVWVSNAAGGMFNGVIVVMKCRITDDQYVVEANFPATSPNTYNTLMPQVASLSSDASPVEEQTYFAKFEISGRCVITHNVENYVRAHGA